MLFASVGQGWIFLIFLEFGILFALLDELPKFLTNIILNPKMRKTVKKHKQNSDKITFVTKALPPKKPRKKFVNLTCVLGIDFVRTVCAGVLVYFATLWLNYGQFRLYILLAFIIGFCLERSFIAKPVTNGALWVYNHFKIKKSEKYTCPQKPNLSP